MLDQRFTNLSSSQFLGQQSKHEFYIFCLGFFSFMNNLILCSKEPKNGFKVLNHRQNVFSWDMEYMKAMKPFALCFSNKNLIDFNLL